MSLGRDDIKGSKAGRLVVYNNSQKDGEEKSPRTLNSPIQFMGPDSDFPTIEMIGSMLKSL